MKTGIFTMPSVKGQDSIPVRFGTAGLHMLIISPEAFIYVERRAQDDSRPDHNSLKMPWKIQRTKTARHRTP
jgi:hypothetical protein